MCEIMSIAAAIAVSAAFFLARRAGRPASALGTTALALWGAALMWSVDGVFSFAEGEGFFDLSAGDAALGALVLACAAVLFAFLRVRESRTLAPAA